MPGQLQILLRHVSMRVRYKQNQMSELRQSMMLDTEITGSKRRFGLFSQPPSTAIGDDSPFKQKLTRRGGDGKPLTLPRNMLPGPNRSGVDRKSFIDPVGTIYAKDPYVDPGKRERQTFLELHSKAPFHERDFIPASAPKQQAESPYRHIDENPLPKIYPARDDTGRVVALPRNFTTNPTSRVDHEVFKPYRHLADPLERQAQMESKERKLAKQKMLPELFRSMSHGDVLFSNSKKTFGSDQRTEEFLKRKHSHELSPPVKTNHESSFKLAIRGHGDPIGKFPEFILPNPEEGKGRGKGKKEEKDQTGEERELWKPNGNKSLSRPTPSISYSSTNLRKYL